MGRAERGARGRGERYPHGRGVLRRGFPATGWLAAVAGNERDSAQRFSRQVFHRRARHQAHDGRSRRRFGHDLALPYVMVQHGRRAVFEPDAVAWEKPSRDIEDEYRRKVRMFEHCWLIVLRGKMLRRLGPIAWPISIAAKPSI